MTRKMKAFVLAGGLPQIELLKQLKDRGIATILGDGGAAPLAKDYADVFYQVDIFDIEAVKKIAVAEKVDFLITVCADQVLLVVAQVSEELGLPWYISYETAVKVSSKTEMKKIFWANKIPTSKYIVTDTLTEDKIKGLSFPIVVKPVDAYSSRGVRKAVNYAELVQFFQEAQSISRDSKDVVVEEFCEGIEISVDVFVVDGKAKILCVSNSQKILDDGRFVIFRGKYPVCITNKVIEKIEKVAQQIVDAFGLKNAPMLIQMIATEDDVRVLEFCARTGGNMKYLLIKHVCGFDVIKAVIDLTLGTKPVVQIKEPENKYIVNDFIYGKEGVFDHLEGFDEMMKEGYITDYHPIRPSGFVCHGVRSSSDRVVGITVQADTLEDFNRKHKYAVDHVAVIDKDGNDIMRHDLLPELSVNE